MGQLLNYAIDITDDLLINKLLNENNIHLKQTDHEGKDNPLVRALDKNLSWMIIPKLLSKHNWQAYQPSDKYNLLYYPIKNKNLTTLQLLLNAGADPNQYLKTDRSVLQQAVLSGEPGWVEILLEYDAKDNTGDALKAAIRQGNVEMVAQLSAIARPIDHLISLYPSLLSLARSLPTSSSERIIDILKFQINEKQLKQPLFDQIMSVAAMKEMAYIPFKPVGRLYQAILNSLDRLHRTSGSEKITTAFKLKIQIAHYQETNPRKDRRQEAFLILDEEINTALFTPETTTSSIKIIIDFAKNDLPFVIDLYQWVSSHSMQASINFLIDKLKKQPNPAAHFNEIKNIYSGATYLTYPLTIDQWDSKYSGAARNELNRQFSENPAPISVALRQEGQGLLFGYRDDTHYQKSLECIQLYMPSLKKKGVTTICLPLNKAEEQSITSYMKPPGGTRDISTLINLNTALKHLCIEASLRDMKIIALMPEDPPDNTLQRVLSDQSIVTKLNDLSAQLPSDEKFIALYSHPRLLSQKLKNGFLPGIALRLGLPALEVSRYRLSLLDDLPYRSQNQAQPWAKTRTHLRGPADQPHFGPQSVSSFHSVEETRPRYAYEIAVINPHDTNALWAAGKWLKEDLERRYLIGMDGEHFNLYSPNGHPADVPQEALQAFRTALTSIPNKSIRLLFVGEKLRLPPTTEFSAATAQWNGQSLDGIRERISDFINKNLTGLRVENIQVVLGQIIVITDLDANNQPLPVRTEVTVDYLAPLRSAASNMHVEPLLQQHHTIIPTGLRGGNAEYSDAIEPIQLVAQRRLPPHSPEVITSADKKLIVKVAKVQRKFPLQELTRQVTAAIEQLTHQLNNNVAKTRYRFKKFATTVEGETELVFVPIVKVRQAGQQSQEKAPREKRLTSDNDVFINMCNQMKQLEPEIAHIDGVSTLNLAFLLMHLLARQHEYDESAWKKFVGIANLTQILHGIGQDMGRLANTVKILNGAGAKAEGMLGKLMGGSAYTHSGSVVNMAVDVINLIDTIEDLKQMPAGPQKDFAVTRMLLASTQLTMDGTVAVLGLVASFSPVVANGMLIAGPLTVPFAGVMIGANSLVTAVAYNNAHYQVELDQIIAPFRHPVSKTALRPMEILQPDGENPQVMYFVPYVPIKKIIINGEKVSVQVADIGIPQFKNNASREHTSDYSHSLSAYSAFGFDVTTPCEQSVQLQPASLVVLPAALNGHYNFMHDVGAYGRLDGKEIFNRFHQHHDTLFPFTIGGVNAPNHVRFHPRPTQLVIGLDAGVRYITFQNIQQVNKIPGQDHYGLRAGQLPTPITDAKHAHYLTYQFQGAGGTTFIDLPDDGRQVVIKPSSDALERLSESWVLDITPDIAISGREARIALQQAHIERLALHHSGEEWALTLANSTVKITRPTPENIRLQLRPIELPGVTFNLTLASNALANPKFHLSLAVESIATLSGDTLSNMKPIMQRYFSDSTRFFPNQQIRLDIQLKQGDIATGLLDLPSQHWQVIHNDGSNAAHPQLYTSEGLQAALLAGPDAWVRNVAHIEYDHRQQQCYVTGIAKPRDNPQSTLSYRYYPHLPKKKRYQQIEIEYIDEENGREAQLLEQLLDEIHEQSSQEVIPIHLPATGLHAEYTWNSDRKFFKKMVWEQNEYQFIVERNDSVTSSILTVIALPSLTPKPFTISSPGADFLSKYRNALSSLTLVVQDNTPKVDLLDFPLIPIKVFARLETKIVGAPLGTTLFLHASGLPQVTFKLTAQQRVPEETALKWGVSLYAENQEAVQGANRAKIVHILQNHKNNSLSWDIGLSIPLSIGDNPDGQADMSACL